MERDYGAWINLLSHRLKKQMNAALSDLNITGVQSRILRYIIKHFQDGPVFQKDVEDAFGLSRSTATGILQLLERDGVILRESVAYDARLKSLVPTEKARQMDIRVRTCAHEMEGILTKNISPGQLQVFLEVAAQMSENLDASQR